MNFKTGRVNHSTEYSLKNGKHTNWVESYFARLRSGKDIIPRDYFRGWELYLRFLDYDEYVDWKL